MFFIINSIPKWLLERYTRNMSSEKHTSGFRAYIQFQYNHNYARIRDILGIEFFLFVLGFITNNYKIIPLNNLKILTTKKFLPNGKFAVRRRKL